jgi:diguanylate cyclase (GGDEF)-like protein
MAPPPHPASREARRGGRPARANAPSVIDDLLASDPFRFTRDDAALRQLEGEVRRRTTRPYWHLLGALLGVAERVTERRAQALWRRCVAHRRRLTKLIGRLVPLRAAAIDWLYLHDEPEHPIRPLVVSRAALVRIAREARIDPVTGLPRRASFERALSLELRSRPFVRGWVAFIDLDGFKRANDRLGHRAGDLVLWRFAQVARKGTRRADLLGRLGGDEFALALFGIDGPRARAIVLRLRARFEAACAEEGVSFSFGLAEVRADDTPREALARADARMYRQKRHRKRAPRRPHS